MFVALDSAEIPAVAVREPSLLNAIGRRVSVVFNAVLVVRPHVFARVLVVRVVDVVVWVCCGGSTPDHYDADCDGEREGDRGELPDSGELFVGRSSVRWVVCASEHI